MKMKIFGLLAASICLFQTAFAQETVATVNQRGYLLGPGDVVEAKVMGESDYNFKSAVDEDGNIALPYTENTIQAKCRTEVEIKGDVVKYVSKYLRNPQVSLSVERKSPAPATIYGEVRQQQQVVLTRKAHLVDLLAFAGGVTEKAGGMIQVFRTQPPACISPQELAEWKAENGNGVDVPSRIYSLNSVRLGKETSNPAIYPGDIIVVEKAPPVYVVGEVVRPSDLAIPEGGLPLTQAIAMANGITREAKTKIIKIHRRVEGSAQPKVIEVSYELIKKGQQKDVMLEPYDIVEVDKAKKQFKDYLIDFVTGTANRIPIPIRPY